jgi:5-methylcytosine-specific restriction endonuclease McrA
MAYDRRDADARYDEAKRRLHPDFHFWRSRREWRDRLRPQQLSKQPLCQSCHAALATTVDHIKRPMGDPQLQRDPANLMSLCMPCHARKTQDDQRGFSKACDDDGYPTDPRHLAYQDRGIYHPKRKR